MPQFAHILTTIVRAVSALLGRMNATEIISSLTETELEARLSKLEAERSAARILLRAVRIRDRSLQRDKADRPQEAGQATGGGQ